MAGEEQKQEEEATAKNPEKEKADAETAQIKRDQARLEQDEWKSPLAKQARESELVKKMRDNAPAQLKDLVPDLSKVERGELKDDGKAFFGTALAHHALAKVASDISDEVNGAIFPENTGTSGAQPPPAKVSILLTSDIDLLSSDAVYDSVKSGIKRLTDAAKAVLDEISEEDPLEEPKEQITDVAMQEYLRNYAYGIQAGRAPGHAGGAALGAVAAAAIATGVAGGSPILALGAAVASAAPAVISLLATNRSLSSADLTVSDVAAVAAVAGALARKRKYEIFHDDFRLLPLTKVQTAAEALFEQRKLLVIKKLELQHQKSKDETRLARLQDLLKADVHEEPDVKELNEHVEELVRLRLRAELATARVAVIDSNVGAINEFTSVISTTRADGGRSPLTIAIMREHLHEPFVESSGEVAAEVQSADPINKPANDAREGGIAAVLVIKSAGGSVSQVISDRPVRADLFSTVAAVSVTYMLITTKLGALESAGTLSANAYLSGEIGKDLSSRNIVVKSVEAAP